MKNPSEKFAGVLVIRKSKSASDEKYSMVKSFAE